MKNLHGINWDFEKSITFNGEKFKCGELVEIVRKNKYKDDGYEIDRKVGRIIDINYRQGKWCHIILDNSENYYGSQISISLWNVVEINKVK